jgi:hypothetical protein
MKYYLATLNIRIGEYGTDTSIRFATDGEPDAIHHHIAKTFWGKSEEDDETYYFDGGQVAVEVGVREEVSKEVFYAIPNQVACLFNKEGW